MSTRKTLAVFFENAVTEETLRYVLKTAHACILPQATADRLQHVTNAFPNCTVHALEMFTEVANVHDAYRLTEQLCTLHLANGWHPADETRYGPYKLWWPNVKQIYATSFLPYLHIRPLCAESVHHESVILFGEVSEKTVFKQYLAAFRIPFTDRTPRSFRLKRLVASSVPWFLSFIQITITLLSALVFAFRRPRVAIWSGDRITTPHDYDFRLEDIYRHLRAAHIPFAEYVRSYSTSKEFFTNLIRRRRPVLYYESFVRPFKWWYFQRGKNKIRSVLQKQASFIERLAPFQRFLLVLGLQVYPDCEMQKASIPIIRMLLKIVGTTMLFAPGAYSRSATILIACKQNGVFTFGLQHGGYFREYHPDESAVFFHGAKSYALDLFGVWSDYWRDYYGQEKEFFAETSFPILGPLRDFPDVPEPTATDCAPANPIRVLLLSEPIVDSNEILPYVNPLFDNPRFRIILKCRPDKNDPILMTLGDRAASLTILSGRMEEAYAQSDVVLGSNSNALLEALYFYKPIVLVKTKKWGDYFGSKKIRIGHFVESPQELPTLLVEAASLSPHERIRQKQIIWGTEYHSGPKHIIEIIRKRLKESP